MSLRSIARQAKFVLPAVQVGAVQMRSKVTKAAKKPVAKKSASKKVSAKKVKPAKKAVKKVAKKVVKKAAKKVVKKAKKVQAKKAKKVKKIVKKANKSAKKAALKARAAAKAQAVKAKKAVKKAAGKDLEQMQARRVANARKAVRAAKRKQAVKDKARVAAHAQALKTQMAALKARIRKAQRAAAISVHAALKDRYNRKKAGKQDKKTKKAKIASSGPISARTLFVQKTMKGTKLTLKDVNTKWTALSTQQRGVFEAEAAKNKAKRTAIRQSLKKPATKYALFTKKHFTAEYTAAMKSGLPQKETFANATRAVAKKYRSQ